MSVGIYKYTNKINGKVYIGQSKILRSRRNQHLSSAFNPNSNEYDSLLHRAMRKYGYENFDYEILENCLVSELDEKEIYWIEQYNSYGEGYNLTKGGNSPTTIKITEENLEKITKELRETDLEGIEIAKKYGLNDQTISDINVGVVHRRDIKYPIRERKRSFCIDCGKPITAGATRCIPCNEINSRKVERPSPMVLAKEILDWGFSATARKYGVTDNAIKKWCVAYGMGKLKHEVAVWYSKQNGDLVQFGLGRLFWEQDTFGGSNPSIPTIILRR